MLRVTFLSTILAVATAGAAPKSFMSQFVDPAPVLHVLPALAPNSAARTDTVIRQARDGLFYVDALVNGALVHFVVDTGANLVVLNTRDAERAGIGGSNPNVHVETAGGTSSMRRTNIDHLVIAGQSIRNVDTAVVRNDLKVSLLGQSALSKLESVAFSRDRLRLN